MFLYNLAIHLLIFGVRVASLFNSKARALVSGRKNLLTTVQNTFASNTSPVTWIHCSSLGEFEQGRPIIERLRKEFPGHKLLLTFFSPSGYEVRKNFPGADYVFYLPFDTPSNARKWVEVTRPSLVIFVKYEFWFNYSEELRKNNIPLISVSAIFRENQVFFKGHGGFFRKILRNFDHIFVQNLASLKLLQTIGINKVTVAGDTRFDRVHEITSSKDRIELAETFKGTDKVMVAGSCWHEDIEVLVPFINETPIKFIIAPHEITESFLQEIERAIDGRTVRFSKAAGDRELDEANVLLIDNVGMLSKLYRYGEFAYVGGAFGKGLHNILEAACYGIPVFFGNKNYQKFTEANELIMHGGAFEVNDFSDLRSKYEMVNMPENFMLACEVTRNYVLTHLGATEKIIQYCRRVLSK
ncbi:MAG TPA: glycosyltransferase N-terminal domain-containing protein [Cyclobacteriaceae bacterium]|nr:glycosyltransferase N-terminal domain-containing protein [Cyclobacteriaceae bacterium]